MLSFAQAPLRVGAPPTKLTPQNLSPQSGLHAAYRHYFTRGSLYELVWTSPVTEIAEHPGVSDVALAKLSTRGYSPTRTGLLGARGSRSMRECERFEQSAVDTYTQGERRGHGEIDANEEQGNIRLSRTVAAFGSFGRSSGFPSDRITWEHP